MRQQAHLTKMKRRIVEVEWFDAQSSMESWTIEEMKELKPLHTFSCGYLIHDLDDRIILGFMDFGEGLIKHHQCIPKGMIKNIKTIRK